MRKTSHINKSTLMTSTFDSPELQKLFEKMDAISAATFKNENKIIRNSILKLQALTEFGWSRKQTKCIDGHTFHSIEKLSEPKIISLLEEIYDCHVVDEIAKNPKYGDSFHGQLLRTHDELSKYNSGYTENIKETLLWLEVELFMKVKKFKPQKTLGKLLPNTIVFLSENKRFSKSKQDKRKRSITFKSNMKIISSIRNLNIRKMIGISILFGILFGYIIFPEYNSYFNGEKITFSEYKEVIKKSRYLIDRKTDLNIKTTLLSFSLCFGLLMAVSNSSKD